MSPLVRATHHHYKTHLGPAESVAGFEFPDGTSIDVVLFRETPCEGATTAVTAGLGDRFGQELIFAAYTPQFGDGAKLLGAIAKQVMTVGTAMRRGQLLEPAGPILPAARLEGFYAGHPAYFPQELELLTMPNGARVRLLWLVPIDRPEAAWIAARGGSAFEAQLETLDPDLLDLTRPTMDLG